MTLMQQQEKLFVDSSPVPHTVFVNDWVSFQTEDNQRVILVHGIVFSHYSLDDRSAEAYALVLLFESGYADQNDLAHCFGYSRRLCKMPPISNPPRISCASRYSRSVLHIGREFCELFARHSTRPTHGFLALNSKCITRLQPPPEGKKRTAFRCTMSGALKLVEMSPFVDVEQ